MNLRCAWCGRFLRRDIPLVAWRVRVAPAARQVPDDEWNYWVKRVHPEEVSHIHTLWWEPVTVEEAIAARGDLALGTITRAAL